MGTAYSPNEGYQESCNKLGSLNLAGRLIVFEKEKFRFTKSFSSDRYAEINLKSLPQNFATNQITIKAKDHLSMELHLVNCFYAIRAILENYHQSPNHEQV